VVFLELLSSLLFSVKNCLDKGDHHILAIEIEMLADFLTGDKTPLPEVKSRLEALQHHNVGGIFSVSEKRHKVEF